MLAPEELDWSSVRFLTIEDLIVRVVKEDQTMEFSFPSERELNERLYIWASQPGSQADVLPEAEGDTVLLVEPNVLRRKEIREFLEENRFNILEAASGFEALTTLKNHDVDLILANYLGHEVELVGGKPGLPDSSAAPIIAYSFDAGSAGQEFQAKVARLGARLAVCCVPNFQALLAASRQILKENRAGKRS
jgi:PleD family two-component response regulator